MISNAESVSNLFAEASDLASAPLWTVMESMVPSHPEPKAVPHLWRWSSMRPLLERAGRLVGVEEAERRVLMLVNPAMRAPYTSDTLYAGLQLINPGETARAHRHVSFALRFIIEGEHGFTAVNGDKITMSRGDFVLTPSWTYHDHGHEGSSPMIWLDGLDLPLFQALPASFAERYGSERFPSKPAAQDCALRFSWASMQARLDELPGPFASAAYTMESGEAVSKVIGAAAERVASGSTSGRRRETTSAVYHVYEGSGSTRVGDETLAWERGDTFVVPAWMPYEHRAAASSTAYLFRFDDRPLLEALGFYRREES